MSPGSLPSPFSGRRRKGKDIPRLPLSAFGPPSAGTSDTFPLQVPPTPSLINPSGVVDSHLQFSLDAAGGCETDISHLKLAHKRAVVLSSRDHSAAAIVNSLQSLQSAAVDAPILSVLIPFALESTEIPQYLFTTDLPLPAFATAYDGTIPVAVEGEEESKDQTQVEAPVRNLHWALQHSRVVDLNIEGAIVAADASFYDSLVNLLTKATKSNAGAKRTPIVLTNVLPPPLDSIMPVVTMMNHPTYTTYRQRVSLFSLMENVYVKLLPPTWVSAGSTARQEEKQERELRNVLKLFIVPALEAFGFERIIFGSSPASASSSPVLAGNWYKLVLESFRELAVSQNEMDKIFIENAERVYGST